VAANTDILVVEDEDALATLLQYNLDTEGYSVRLAAETATLVADATQRHPRVG
jgi:two-component system phosphate regulon response regulator PhoB